MTLTFKQLQKMASTTRLGTYPISGITFKGRSVTHVTFERFSTFHFTFEGGKVSGTFRFGVEID